MPDGDQQPANRAAAGAQKFRMPETWEAGRPQFDGKTYNKLDKYLEQVGRIIKQGGIEDDGDQKEKYLYYLEDNHVIEGWQMLKEYTNGTCEAWIKAVKGLYPELEEKVQGSLTRLKEICEEAQGCTRAELGRIRRFQMFFEAEAAKLMKPPAQVTNVNLVGTILKVLDPGFSRQIEDAMNLPGVSQIIQQAGGQVPAAAAAAAVGTMERRGDRMTYTDVLKVAVYLATNWTGREALFEISGGQHNERPLIETTPPIKGLSAPPYAVKKEFTDQIEGFALEIAAMKDTFSVRDRQMQETLKKFETVAEQARVLSQGVAKAPTQQPNSGDYRPTPNGQFHREPNSYRMAPPPHLAIEDINCHWCGEKGHMMANCVKKNEKIDRGHITIENGQARLPGNLFIPRYPEHLTRDQRVEEWHRKNATGAGPAAVNMYQMSFMNEAAYPDQFDQHYDTTQDELRSARAQQALMARELQQFQQNRAAENARNRGTGSAGGMYGQGREAPPHMGVEQYYPSQNSGQQGQSGNMNAQFVQTPQAPASTNQLGLAQLLSLLNVAGTSGSSDGNGRVLDQLVATREQLKKSGQTPSTNF